MKDLSILTVGQRPDELLQPLDMLQHDDYLQHDDEPMQPHGPMPFDEPNQPEGSLLHDDHRLPIDTYQEFVARFPLLTAEQERALAVRIAQGDAQAVHTLVQGNLRLVIRMARRYTTQPALLMELVGEGNVGLTLAAQRYRADRREGEADTMPRFSTYAVWWIRRYILRYLEAEARRRSWEVCEADLMPTCAQAGCEPDQTDATEAAGEDAEPAGSLLATLGGAAPDEEAAATADSRLQELSAQERRVLVLMLGLEDKPLSRHETARRMGISPQRVSQLRRQAVRRLRASQH